MNLNFELFRPLVPLAALVRPMLLQRRERPGARLAIPQSHPLLLDARSERSPALVAVFAALSLLGAWSARADLPAPDNLLYGSIVLGNRLITSADTNFIVEARKSLAGPAVSTYRLGEEPAAGNFYLLKVALEEMAPRASVNSALVGDTVFVVVRDQSGPRATNSFVITERGLVTRRDFGTAPGGDTDGDGLPDAWEVALFGNLNRNGLAVGANGQSLTANYVAGTDPNNPNDRFDLTITPVAPNKFISFLARTAAGAGYEGQSRYYALEFSTNAAGPWSGVPNRTNILGNNTTVSYPTAEPGATVFYRGRVRLQAP